MTSIPDFDFGSDNVAESYDAGLVPVLFVPWAKKMIHDHGPWSGRVVMDLAAGTGVVSKMLGPETGRSGQVLSADINAQMLRIAERNCSNLEGNYTFVCCSADSLECPDSAFDTVVCQQGFQFFPDKQKAAGEIYRVLKPGGKAVISTWLPVELCSYFGELCLTLEDVGDEALSAKMRVPFDHMTANELKTCFDSTGFENVLVEQHELPLTFSNGVDEAVAFAFSTPIASQLNDFPEAKKVEFKSRLKERLEKLKDGSNTFGSMVSTVLTASRTS